MVVWDIATKRIEGEAIYADVLAPQQRKDQMLVVGDGVDIEPGRRISVVVDFLEHNECQQIVKRWTILSLFGL